jgi:hypothetical protein
LLVRETNVDPWVFGKTWGLGKNRVTASSTIISSERRLLGWAVTLMGAALMAGGATIVVLSIL